MIHLNYFTLTLDTLCYTGNFECFSLSLSLSWLFNLALLLETFATATLAQVVGRTADPLSYSTGAVSSCFTIFDIKYKCSSWSLIQILTRVLCVFPGTRLFYELCKWMLFLFPRLDGSLSLSFVLTGTITCKWHTKQRGSYCNANCMLYFASGTHTESTQMQQTSSPSIEVTE